MERIAEIVRKENRELLEGYANVKLLSVKDVARTLNVSKRTVETLIAEGQLCPLWVRGQRRFHPDAIDGYLKRCERRGGGGTAHE